MDTKLTPEQRAEIANAESAAEELDRAGQTVRRCLVCGGELVVEEVGASYLVRCKKEGRVITTSRGI
jgi:serine/threonine protein phosphatase PrpC